MARKNPKPRVASASLNDKQRRFAAEYLIDLNATQAAIRAGYSPKAAMLGGALHAIWEAAKEWAEIAAAAISDFRVWIAEELHEIRVMWIAEQRVGASGPAKAEGLSHVSPSAAPYSGKVFGMSSRVRNRVVAGLEHEMMLKRQQVLAERMAREDKGSA